MPGELEKVAVYGTSEEPVAVRAVRKGDLSLLLDGETIRRISWKGVEVVRGITWPVRDESWITLAPQDVSERLDVQAEPASYEQTFSVADGALACRVQAKFGTDGVITAEVEMTATRDFQTNRAGFTVLHPLHGVAGNPLVVRHSDGTEESTSFPRYISPGQPAMDITGLRHVVRGIGVDIAFSGEIFEMEDQRNWTDASYKTYCVPLAVPFTYTIAKGETVRQGIRIMLDGEPEQSGDISGSGLELVRKGSFPEIALAVDSGWMPEDDAIETVVRTGIRALQLRIGSTPDTRLVERAARLVRAMEANLDLEIVLGEGVDPGTGIRQARSSLAAAGIEPRRVMALPETYCRSYQPSGPWPEGPAPSDCSRTARTIFANAQIGGGALTNFTEFNRCRPDPALCDYVTHSTTAIVHAADDRSVIETIEALPFIFESTEKISGGKPCCLGLVTIGMRSNPYGADVADNPGQIRTAMAKYDPRQRGLFAAAFAVGAVSAMQETTIRSVALAAPAGPFAILAGYQPVPCPYFDDTPAAKIHPLYHVVRAMASMAGKPRVFPANLPSGIRAIGADGGNGTSLIFTNLGDAAKQIRLPDAMPTLMLDPARFEAAVADPDWLERAESQRTDSFMLAPFSVAFVNGLAL